MQNHNSPLANKLTVAAALRRAYAHWEVGQAGQAERLCNKVMAVAPDHPGAMHLLGIMAHAYGKLDKAITCLEVATRSSQAPARFYSNLAEMYRLKGCSAQAEQAARHAVLQDPHLTDAWNNLGIIAQENGKLPFSLECLQKVLAARPDNSDVHNNLANTYRRLDNVELALQHYQQALVLNPDYVQVYNNQASLLCEQGRLDEAAAAAERAIEIAPHSAEAYRRLAEVEKARRAQHPDSVGKEAISALSSLPPDVLAACHRQAIDLYSSGRYAETEAVLMEVLGSGSGPLVLWYLLARALRAQCKMAQTLPIFEMLVRRRPTDMIARFDLATQLLLQGDFTRGWREYRFRYQMEHTSMVERHMQKPRWEGQRLDGKRLLIHDEQGFGDTFQFLRLVQAARERSGAHLILEVNRESATLARSCDGWDEVILRGTLPPPFDSHCELMSLPLALGLQLDDLPGTTPYLFADPARIAHWRTRLADVPRPWVGLVWAGRPEHTNDKNRSMRLNDLAPLAQDGISFLALQKGPAAIQAMTPPPGMNLLALSDEIKNFDDTAAILSLIDVLVSVDSSPVHLAGALGRPAWVVLPFVPEWRWMQDRDDTPWYPSLTLFRQPQQGQWAPVMENIARKLADLPRSQP